MTAAIYDSYQFMTVMTGAFYLGRATIRSHLVAAKRLRRDASINFTSIARQMPPYRFCQSLAVSSA
jgi:hypothetical protein